MQLSPRGSLMPVALFAFGALTVIGYHHMSRAPAQVDARAVHARSQGSPSALGVRSATAAPTPPAPEARRVVPVANEDNPTVATTPEAVATWIAQATGTDATKRAAAITALGSAPSADAVPVLERVLQIADDADRPLALQALRTLAQREGDANDQIRSVVRRIIFHAGDEAATQAAQTTLDEIERDLSLRH